MWQCGSFQPFERPNKIFASKIIYSKQPTTPPLVASSNYQHKTHIKQIRVFTIYRNMYEINNFRFSTSVVTEV